MIKLICRIVHIIDKFFSCLSWVSLSGRCIVLEQRKLIMVYAFVNKFRCSEFTVTVSWAVTALVGGASEESLAFPESLVPDQPSAKGGIEECVDAFSEKMS